MGSSIVAEIKEYRELINAIWVRMIVSYGSGLTSGTIDNIGDRNHSHLSYEELRQAYSRYIEGQDFDVPGGRRNYALFTMTMAIQELFDRVYLKYNQDADIPGLNGLDIGYRSKAIAQGVRPLFLASMLLFAGLYIRSNIFKYEHFQRNK
ncbi:hypothetical protein A3I51_04290 [Candidatus Gottesmanbacteria bacterium RIFCSPLOWO2_02_FULL_38_8]|uniref:Uncharacterized protein n=1 Tax=Candidatus Gottesmanbacteria bacterium RIFCSPLOWO2_02_FULL_38_8 TaxID=1798397 RepID=A0A1F6B2B6_9BACT|nr:MAG: hypothetical protein A3I51_04290 [Candidatus Gottesmanbacteria bacterium RIFCSPLOWO2_02_FULL_38_8]